MARSAAKVGGFGVDVQQRGLDAALSRLGLSELIGRKPAEVVAAIASHIADAEEALNRDLVRKSLQDALFEVVDVTSLSDYADFSEAIQGTLNAEGISQLLEAFLSNFASNALWMKIEDWVDKKARTPAEFQALMQSFSSHCRTAVREELGAASQETAFDSVDWFGSDGLRIANTIADNIEQALRGLQ